LKAELEATLKQKTAAYKQNQVVRKQELEAIAKAIEIISSPDVAGSYGKHINLAQEKGLSFLQRGMESRGKAVEYLRARARALGSKTLSLAVARAGANPSFEKITGMIEDLLAKLKEEAAAEAEHKAWCDEQLKANKLKRNKKTAQSNKLIADIEGLTADIADMGSTITKLIAEQQALTQAMAEATEVREAEKAENTATIADAQAGSKAVKAALALGMFLRAKCILLSIRCVSTSSCLSSNFFNSDNSLSISSNASMYLSC